MSRFRPAFLMLPALVLAAYLPFVALHAWALLRTGLGAALLPPALSITGLGPLLVLWEYDFVLDVSRATYGGAVPGWMALGVVAVLLGIVPAAGVWAWRRGDWPPRLLWAVCWLLWFAVGLRMWLAVWTLHVVQGG